MAESKPKAKTGSKSTGRSTGKTKTSSKSSGSSARAPGKSSAKSSSGTKTKTAAKSKAKPKSRAKPKRKTTTRKKGPPPLPTLKEAREWLGLRVDDSGGGSLGKVSGLHVDAESKQPKWLVAKIGRFAGEAAIPFDHVAEAGGRVWTAYERDAVRQSPKMKASQTLNTRQELQLCEHYGIRKGVGRAAELADRDGDEISAVPADDA